VYPPESLEEADMHRARLWTGALLLGWGLLASTSSSAVAQDDLKKDVEDLKRGQQQILQQLQELKQMLQAQARPAAPVVKDALFDLGTNPVKGSPTAKLTLIEFTDYQ
jgi:protein-disulfide isomerase